MAAEALGLEEDGVLIAVEAHDLVFDGWAVSWPDALAVGQAAEDRGSVEVGADDVVSRCGGVRDAAGVLGQVREAPERNGSRPSASGA